MNPISLKILFYNDNASELADLGIETDMSESDVREIIFFNINAISPYIVDNKQYTCIHSNGSEFICIETYDKLIEKILTNTLLY